MNWLVGVETHCVNEDTKPWSIVSVWPADDPAQQQLCSTAHWTHDSDCCSINKVTQLIQHACNQLIPSPLLQPWLFIHVPQDPFFLENHPFCCCQACYSWSLPSRRDHLSPCRFQCKTSSCIRLCACVLCGCCFSPKKQQSESKSLYVFIPLPKKKCIQGAISAPPFNRK